VLYVLWEKTRESGGNEICFASPRAWFLYFRSTRCHVYRKKKKKL